MKPGGHCLQMPAVDDRGREMSLRRSQHTLGPIQDAETPYLLALGDSCVQPMPFFQQ